MATKSDVSEVSCPCGASLRIDPNETTQEMACPECGMTLEIVVTTDPRTKQSKVGILVKSTAVNPRSGKSKDVHIAKCVCGAQITIEEDRIDSVYTCVICDADYTASIRKSRSGLSTLVLRPLVAAPARATARRVGPRGGLPTKTIIAPKASEKTTVTKVTKGAPPPTRTYKSPPIPAQPQSAGAASKEKLLLLAKGEVGAQEVSFVGKDQLISCFCGGMILLRDGFNREIVKCPVCSKGYRIFLALQPKTAATMAVMIPRG
ncbi:MAG TPA: hypothetical protein VKW04_22285 [Planctomycetota bacterium]|nr:hypothetical protein [Planctomycetota bacterium]